MHKEICYKLPKGMLIDNPGRRERKVIDKGRTKHVSKSKYNNIDKN